MNKLKAYTVVEMLVVMIVSTICISITFTSYKIFSNQYYLYKITSDTVASYHTCDKLMTMDFSQALKVERTIKGLLIYKKDKKVEYEFSEKGIIRNDLLIDTFPVYPLSTEMFLGGKSQYLPGGLIDEFYFECQFREQNLFFHYQKNYGADVWIRLEENEY